MTGAELCAAREALHATQAELGAVLGRHGVTLCKWEKGPGPIPAWVAGVVSTLAEGQRRQGARLPAFRDALVQHGPIKVLSLWLCAGAMDAERWPEWVASSSQAEMLPR